MTEAEIKKAVDEAAMHAEEDKKMKEETEIRNNADSLVYQTEKALKDMEEKIPPEEKAKIEGMIQGVKDALKGGDTKRIKDLSDELQKAFYDISSKMYSQAQGAPGQEESAGQEDPGPSDDVYEADYEVEDEDK
jgi:molecular chaperone DnaK